MRWLSILIVAISTNSFADDHCEKWPVSISPQSDGTAYKIYLSESEVIGAGAWDIEDEEPPLSVGQARTIAEDWIAHNFNGYEDAVVWQVRLNRFPCPASEARESGLYWHYDIKYYLEFDSRKKRNSGYFVVLMSGDVVAPVLE